MKFIEKRLSPVNPSGYRTPRTLFAENPSAWRAAEFRCAETTKGGATASGHNRLRRGYRRNAKNAVATLLGATGVSNHIKVKSRTDSAIEKDEIESALKRNWSVSDQDIGVAVSGHKATPTGTVDSWYQKDEAERIAWRAPGVRNVGNELVVDYDYS